MAKFEDIKEKINTNLDYSKFKIELLKNINTNGLMLEMSNKLDIDNKNGDEVDVMELANIILEDKTINLDEDGIYGIYFKSDAYSFLMTALGVLKYKKAAILCTDLYNYASINLLYALIHDILKQKELDGIIYLKNDTKENFFESIDSNYIQLDLE